MKTPTIRNELRQWILDTARAGHGVPEVLELLRQAGYEARASRRIVAEVLNLPAEALRGTVERPAGRRTRHPAGPLARIDGHEVRIALGLDRPPLRVLEHMLADDECEGLIGQARPRLQRARTVAVDGTQQVDASRTSAGMFFALGESPLVARIEQRIADLFDLPVEHGEGLQVLHYLPGQEYEPHYDWFDPGQPGFAAVTARGGQRVASVVMYLNTPEAGGGTGFPNLGLTVTALRGSAVYFAYEANDGVSLHAGLPVQRGEKWIATKWLRERPFR
ncbi:proline dioxygenase [Frateuria sp. Soil773]|uniref:2OG-Fe(II) oxygenase n=1 Tax=Frateuria sp. Soil773 TaxID=1736407 RepID=UPI00070034D6|nr:2OG-Fe(II) oxygenase [Frateuria sp. Soil773]KRE96526.1 proline dioxygenase [Frateuria sp. Soil773]